MTPHHPKPEKYEISENVNTIDLIVVVSVDGKLFNVNVITLDVCVNVHFTLVRGEGRVLESVRATRWQTR